MVGVGSYRRARGEGWNDPRGTGLEVETTVNSCFNTYNKEIDDMMIDDR